jgi:hypothetical protein
LVDALVSGTSGESRGGSSPLLGTKRSDPPFWSNRKHLATLNWYTSTRREWRCEWQGGARPQPNRRRSDRPGLRDDRRVWRNEGRPVASMTLLLGLPAVLCVVAIIFPALPAVRETQSRLPGLGSAYLLLIGLGFRFIELLLRTQVLIELQQDRSIVGYQTVRPGP